MEESFINKEIKVLDKGFIRLVDVMGSDASIVQAARVSYGAGTKSVSEDRGLIRYLMRHRHTSPFEMVEFKFHVKLPIFIARQWIRHRTANVNEYSGRYSEMKDEFYIPQIEEIRTQSSLNRQGRSEERVDFSLAESIADKMENTQKELYGEYLWYLEKGTARELARINLPLSSYTEWYWKIDLHNLLHFLRLRLDWHAQFEIRLYAEKLAEIVKACTPLAYEAFEDYQLNGIAFSKQELQIIHDTVGEINPDEDTMKKYDIVGLEARELSMKLNKIFK